MSLLPLIQVVAAGTIALGSGTMLYLFCRSPGIRNSRRVIGSLSLILAALAIGRIAELRAWGIDAPWVAAIADLIVGAAIVGRIIALWPDRDRLARSVQLLREGAAPGDIADAASRYHSLFSSAGLGIALRDAASGAVIECNPRYLEIVGRRQQSLLRRGGQEWTKAEFVEMEAEHRRRLIAREIPGYELTKQIVLPDGSFRWVRAWAALANAGTKTMDVLADIDQEMVASIDRDQSMARMAALNRELEGFAYACAHDLKAPLRRIGQRLQMALQLSGDQQLEKIHDAIRMGDRLTDFIEQLLEYGRLDRDSDLTMMAVAVGEIAHAVAYQYEDEAQFVIDPNLPQIRCNPSQIERLFSNLYSNAIKHGGHGVMVTVTAKTQGRMAVLTVADNGPGIDPGLSKNLFELFVRGEDSVGAGLGLAICKKIAIAHGGRIELSPSTHGACFKIYLPLV